MSTSAVVVGAGPNGLAAAIVLASAGVGVTLLEAMDAVGGGMRTRELTLPGFKHDVCAAIHPLAAGSPFFTSLPLGEHGLRWIEPDIALAHPFDDGSAGTLRRSLDDTASLLGADSGPYLRLMRPLVDEWRELMQGILGPMLRIPRHPLLLGRFGLHGLRSARGLARSLFKEPATRALFAGIAAHGSVPLDAPFTAAFGIVLAAAAHAAGWPLAAGGSQSLADALASCFRSLGGDIRTGSRVESLSELGDADAVLLDLAPREVLRLADGRFSRPYRRGLQRFRYGPGVFKLDYALDGPIPWLAEECLGAGTVHVGGSLEEIEASEAMVARSLHPERPFVIVAQQSLFDPTRAPAGKHTGWAYCHVPNGSREDMTDRVEAQIERFAPGFRDLILARSTMTSHDMERYNPNYVGGDIGAGYHAGSQLFLRPMPRLSPYGTSDRRIYLCSASTPPGGGVHGMCGYFAARLALRRLGVSAAKTA
jgi:phytoene dehydrogenase-like protein